MKHLKFTLFLALTGLAINFSYAQSIDDGKKLLQNEKYISAKKVFLQLVTANPNNDEAAYYLGQAMIGPDENKDVAGARDVYMKALQANPNSALLNAGIGHVELLEGKSQEARNHFETAISLSRGKDAQVLDAVGFANGDYDSKLGDAAYAVEKLDQAVSIRDGRKNPKYYTDLGDAYRKLGDGGSAQRAYEAASGYDGSYARAKFRLGRIYQSQGESQRDIFLKYYDEAIAADPNYPRTYFYLYQYFYETDVVKSAEYLDKYLAAKGTDETESCYLRAQMKFAQGLFAETVSNADICIAAEPNPYPNLYGLKAYAAFKLGDTITAKRAFDLYFQKQNPEKIGPRDYFTYATLIWTMPGNEPKAIELIDKAVLNDSLLPNKINYLKWLGKALENQKNYLDAARAYAKVIDIKPNYSNVDLFNVGYNYYISNKLDSSDVYFTMFTEKYPDEVLGYYMIGNSKAIIDSTSELGLAVPFYQKTIEVGEKDVDKPNTKNRLMVAYKYFVGYYYNIKKNRDSALIFVDKALALDPTDASMISNKEFIQKTDPNSIKSPAKKPQGSSTPKNK